MEVSERQREMNISFKSVLFQFSRYDKMVEALGAVGFHLDRSNEEQMTQIFQDAIALNQKQHKSVLINCLIGKTNFREGSISV